jgi:lambda repressor-like predicted transcriptional regulator
MITLKGKTQSIAEWAGETGIAAVTIYARLTKGWPPEAVLKPPKPVSGVIRVELDGRQRTLSEWSSLTGLNPDTIYGRLRRGWPAKEAISRPAPMRAGRNLTVEGETRTIAGWSRQTGITSATIAWRLQRGWSAEKAILTPPTRPRPMRTEIALRGKAQSMAAWARESGVAQSTIRMRLGMDWSAEDAIFTPAGSKMRATGVRGGKGLSLTINGRTQTVTEWAREAGISRASLHSRLWKGWPPEEAVFTPVKSAPPREIEVKL